MFERLLNHREHIPPHRIWAYLNCELEISLPEHLHILNCDECHEVFSACFNAQTFGEALKSLIWKESVNQRATVSRPLF